MEIIAEKRKALGKQNRKLRQNRQIPAVVYGDKMESTALTINALQFINVFKEAGETTLVDLKFNGSNEKVLIKEVQLNPVSLAPIHASFHKVDLTEKIHADIPVEIIGEELSPIVKSGEGMVLTLLNEIEVEALPSDLPPHFEVDVSHLVELDQGVTVGELNYDRSKVTIVGAEDDDLVVKIDHAEMEEIEEEEVDEAALIEGMEVTGEKPEDEEGEEGEKGAEKSDDDDDGKGAELAEKFGEKQD